MEIALKLESVDAVKSPIHMNLKDVLIAYSQILRSNRVSYPVVVDKEFNVIFSGFEVYYALKLLSAEKVPVIQVDISEIDVKPFSVMDIIKADIEGSKLPANSFKVLIKRSVTKLRCEFG